ncbi:winged helix-turn-helix domain-containing protein [Streptomyces canus]
MLKSGPAASGWSDQCWTLARIGEILRCSFGVEYTLARLDLLLHRIAGACRSRAARPPSGTSRGSPRGRTSSDPS